MSLPRAMVRGLVMWRKLWLSKMLRMLTADRLRLGTSMPHRRLAGDGGLHADVRHRQVQGQVVGQRGDPADLDAGHGLHFIPGDRRAPGDIQHPGLDAEALQGVHQFLGVGLELALGPLVPPLRRACQTARWGDIRRPQGTAASSAAGPEAAAACSASAGFSMAAATRVAMSPLPEGAASWPSSTRIQPSSPSGEAAGAGAGAGAAAEAAGAAGGFGLHSGLERHIQGGGAIVLVLVIEGPVLGLPGRRLRMGGPQGVEAKGASRPGDDGLDGLAAALRYRPRGQAPGRCQRGPGGGSPPPTAKASRVWGRAPGCCPLHRADGPGPEYWTARRASQYGTPAPGQSQSSGPSSIR